MFKLQKFIIMSGDNESAYKVFKKILNNGIIDYYLNSEAAFPAQIYNAKCAIRYLYVRMLKNMVLIQRSWVRITLSALKT